MSAGHWRLGRSSGHGDQCPQDCRAKWCVMLLLNIVHFSTACAGIDPTFDQRVCAHPTATFIWSTCFLRQSFSHELCEKSNHSSQRAKTDEECTFWAREWTTKSIHFGIMCLKGDQPNTFDTYARTRAFPVKIILMWAMPEIQSDLHGAGGVNTKFPRPWHFLGHVSEQQSPFVQGFLCLNWDQSNSFWPLCPTKFRVQGGVGAFR